MKPNSVLKLKRMAWLAAGVMLLMIVLLIIATHSGAKPTAPTAAPQLVEVTPVERKDVPIYGEWIGTLTGQVNADIKAQVTGYLLTQSYKEGSYVRKGQPLFEIDPRPFQAALDQVSRTSGVLTTVSTLDPIRDYFTVSEQEYLALRKQFLGSRPEQWKLQLILADGTPYPHQGEFYFADRQVNQNTGTIQLAALFANPGNVLRPGQYGKVRAMMRVQRNALLIPQAAVHEQQGSYVVDVVGNDSKVAVRTVQVGDRTGTMWVIQDGLKAGERVIVEGQDNLKPGMPVQIKAFKTDVQAK